MDLKGISPEMKAFAIVGIAIFLILFFFCLCHSKSLCHLCCFRKMNCCGGAKEHIYELQSIEASAPRDMDKNGYYQRNLKDFNK